MTYDCTCHDPTTLCAVHYLGPERVTVDDVLHGCACAVVDLEDGTACVNVCVTCPVHGAPAFREVGP